MKNQYLIAISLKNDPLTKQYIFSVDAQQKDNASDSMIELYMEIKIKFYKSFEIEITNSDIYIHSITNLN